MSAPLLLLWPSLITLWLIWIVPQTQSWPSDYQTLLHYGPYLLAAVLCILAHPFRQGRIAIAGILCATAYWLIQTYLQQPMSLLETQKVFVLLALLFPINWLALSFCQEHPPLSPLGLMAIVIGLAQLFIGYLLVNFEANFEFWLQGWLQVKDLSWAMQPFSVLLITFICVGCMALKCYYLRQRFDVDTLAIILIGTWMLARLEMSNISALATMAVELILFGTLMHNSYQMAFHDELTQLPGRRALISDLKHANRNYCMAMTDVDHFKKFNDTYGHDVGDDVLKLVAAKLGQVSGGGKAYRYGGEEFAVVFRGNEAAACKPHLEALREVIADYDLVVRNPKARPDNDKQGRQQRGQANNKTKTTHVTISLGLAQREQGEEYEQVMKRADLALYKAKENGRNRLELAS